MNLAPSYEDEDATVTELAENGTYITSDGTELLRSALGQ